MQQADKEYIAKSLEVLAGMLRTSSADVFVGVNGREVEQWLNRLGNFPKQWSDVHPLPEEFLSEFNDLILSAGSDLGVW